MIRTYLLTALAVCASLSSAMAAAVDHVTVEVASPEAPIPELVEKRIAASIQTVGNRVFLQKDSEEITSRAPAYERAVNDIINRVLIGYTVDSLQLVPGADTRIKVKLRPWGDTIQQVHFQLDYGALPALGKQLAAADLEGTDKLAENLLVGLPVDALDWANGAVRSVLENELEARLPEFYPQVVIKGGPKTEVTVYMLPKLPVVRNVQVDIEAENLPKVIFLSSRSNLEKYYAGLEGLPVSFAQRHAREIEASLVPQLQQQWVIRHYGLKVTPSLKVGENTRIHLLSQTDFYDLHGGAYIDIGRDKDKREGDSDTVLMAHLGRKIGPKSEVYSEFKFMPASLDWNVIPGYFYRFTGGSRLGYQFESLDDSHHLWLRYPLTRRWQLRLDRDLTHNEWETGLRYRVDDYVGLEYIVSRHDYWLRVIGYL